MTYTCFLLGFFVVFLWGFFHTSKIIQKIKSCFFACHKLYGGIKFHPLSTHASVSKLCPDIASFEVAGGKLDRLISFLATSDSDLVGYSNVNNSEIFRASSAISY